MNALRNWIIRTGNQTAEPSAVRTALAETVELSRCSERWYPSGIGKLIGKAGLVPLLAGLKADPASEPMLVLITSGIFLDDEETRQTIEDIRDAGLLSTDHAQLLLDAGILYGPLWKKVGLTAEPTTEDIAAVQATIASEELRERVAQRYQSVRDAMDAGEVVTWDAAQDALGAEWEDSQ